MYGHLKEAGRSRWPSTLVLFGAGAAILGLNAGPVDGQDTHVLPALTYGESMPLGQGVARTYLARRPDGSVELGVAISEGGMEGLPVAGDPGGILLPDGFTIFEFELPLPEPNPTPYRHVVLDWNPGGHEPPGVYDLAHFDFHFYLIERDGRLAIDLTDPEFWEKAARHPDPALVPAGYFAPDGATVEGMGVHWLDPQTPELHGHVFTRTFLFGSWNGELIFSEPMITRAHLLTKPNETVRIPAAERPLASGPLPETYSIRWVPEAREYRVAIDLMPMGARSAGGRW
jgi:hypothetical protein